MAPRALMSAGDSVVELIILPDTTPNLNVSCHIYQCQYHRREPVVLTTGNGTFYVTVVFKEDEKT